MMICVDYSCDKCIHKLPNKDGWKCVCEAFPNGIPYKIIFETDVTKLLECNNGIGFEAKKPCDKSV